MTAYCIGILSFLALGLAWALWVWRTESRKGLSIEHFRESWHEAMTGQTHPIEELWADVYDYDEDGVRIDEIYVDVWTMDKFAQVLITNAGTPPLYGNLHIGHTDDWEHARDTARNAAQRLGYKVVEHDIYEDEDYE